MVAPAEPPVRTATIAAPQLVRAIMVGTLVVGLLDGADAVLFNSLVRGIAPSRVFQYIASSVLGRDAFSGGMPAVALGVAMHFGVAACLTTAYCLIAPRFPNLLRRWFWAGAAYGLVTFFIINYAILPLTRVNRVNFPPWLIFTNLVAAHIFCVGVPIAFVAAKRLRGERRAR